MHRVIRLAVLLAFFGGALLPAQSQPHFLDQFAWRSVGPAGAGGRVVSIAAAPSTPQRIYVAAATGGLWKSDSEGASWHPVFDHEAVASIGAVAVDPSNPDTVWVVSGEGNP